MLRSDGGRYGRTADATVGRRTYTYVRTYVRSYVRTYVPTYVLIRQQPCTTWVVAPVTYVVTIIYITVVMKVDYILAQVVS